MRVAIVAILLLSTSCVKRDATSKLHDLGRPDPIECVYVDTGSVACTDGDGVDWICDAESCIRWSGRVK